MIETTFDYTLTDDKKIEILVERDAAMINHVVMPPNDGLPLHNANSDVNLIIIRGTMSAQLGDQEAHLYGKGKILGVPNGTKMNIRNGAADILEFFIVKAPHPNTLGK